MYCAQLISFGTMVIVGASLGQVSPGTTRPGLSEKPVIGQGEVTTDDLYVRSGPSLNHYTVAKLNAGDRVNIVGESGDWYEIVPPPGTFSLMSADYVDSADGRHGVVSGDNVRVRAGSLLNKNKYTVQMKVSKGVEVEIVGREPDGFLRIRPPKGATVWVSRQYLEYVPNERLRQEGMKPPSAVTGMEPATTRTEPGSTPEGDTTVAASSPKPDGQPGPEAVGSAETTASASQRSPFAAYEPTTERRELEELDTEVRSELAKPAVERRLKPFIARYQKVAKGSEDDFARRYAQARVNQLTDMDELLETVRNVRGLVDGADQRRREYLEERAKIRTAMPPARSGLDARGELRVSAVHPPGTWPRRYRLVNATAKPERTVGYVEIPRESTIDVSNFVGRYIGVRASAKRWQTGGVNPVPIFVARELVLLEPASAKPNKTD